MTRVDSIRAELERAEQYAKRDIAQVDAWELKDMLFRVGKIGELLLDVVEAQTLNSVTLHTISLEALHMAALYTKAK